MIRRTLLLLPVSLFLVLVIALLGACSSTPTTPSTTASTVTSTMTSTATTTATATATSTSTTTATTTAAAPIELTYMSFVPQTNVLNANLNKLFFDRIETNSNGRIKMVFKGGPEVMSVLDQGKAVQQDLVDIAFPYVGAYESIVPGIGGFGWTEITPEQERQNGAYEYMLKMHEKAGLYYLGRGTPTEKPYFYTLLNKKVETQADFKGLSIGSTTAARPVITAWGATQVMVNMPDYYSSLERGLVDGLSGIPISTTVSQALQEVTKYIIDEPYSASTVAVIMNLDKWKSLPPDLQKVLTDTMIQSEKDYPQVYAQQRAAAIKTCEDAGVQFYQLSPDVAKWYLDTAYQAGWDYQQERFPDVTPELRKLLTTP